MSKFWLQISLYFWTKIICKQLNFLSKNNCHWEDVECVADLNTETETEEEGNTTEDEETETDETEQPEIEETEIEETEVDGTEIDGTETDEVEIGETNTEENVTNSTITQVKFRVQID